MNQRWHAFVDYLLVFLTFSAVTLAVAGFFGTGPNTSFGGLRVSSQTVFRPLVVALSCALIWLHRSEHRVRRFEQLWAAIQARAHVTAACIAILVSAFAFRVSPFEASGSDSYGYVSQAGLWARGNLIQQQPLARIAPWPNADWTVAPFGYRPGVEAATIVPTYPSGLPLVMAGLSKVFGPFGAFLAVPLLGGLAIFLAHLVGTRLAGPVCGLMSALLFFSSPVFLYHLREPMSDVPVTAWWLAVVLLALRSAPRAAFVSGLAASAAILTRPNLAPLAGLVAVLLVSDSTVAVRTRLQNAAVFSLGVIPGCVSVGLLHSALYGSPLASGYGPASELFSLSHFGPNLSRYSWWLIQTETPFILLSAIALAAFRGRRRQPLSRFTASPDANRITRIFFIFSAALYACYAFYIPFDNWTYLRFLLPAIALLLILSAASLLHLCARLSSPVARSIVATAFVLFVAWRWEASGLKPRPPNDRRFAVIGEYVRDRLPENVIVLSRIHSGSVRHYSARPTLRWDWLPAEWLESSISFLKSNGYRPVLLIEDSERRPFIERFSKHSKLGLLDWPAMASYQGTLPAGIFDPDDQGRFLAGERVGTEIIGAPSATAKANAR